MSAAEKLCRELLDRSVIRRIFGLLLELRVELLDDVADRHLGFDHAARHALAEAADRPVDEGHELGVALQIIVIIDDRLERRGALAAGQRRIEMCGSRRNG